MAIIDLKFALEQVPAVLKGVPWTLTIAIIAMIVGLLFGLLIALVRIYKVPLLNQLSILYISFIRGTPLIVQLYVFFYGVPVLFDYLNPRFGWELNADNISPLIYALIAYSINTAAYQAEIFRGAINATSAGQMEAAYSVGMTTAQGLYRIILPQAFLIALPNLGNLFINLIKATSLAFAVKVMEILAISRIIANDGYRFLEMYLVASIIYWAICLACEIIFAKLEGKMSRFEGRADLKASAS
ncbi:ABC transporter permease [Bacillus sp. FJAT-27231]|uniref:amino acid ABC transporter permease n=1 Tax=Bacillus sp. FJAT-27231 TaxID=1679168 RepID=UPI00067126F4|nr:amino acid ABC transporter permease [Bacillus sp. FJAT-27231]KMY53293.1 ABC transporter permease [Bacillus sp. FJAT-27231]